MISKLIRDALKLQLSASGSGMNDRLISYAPLYGLDDPFQVDWEPTSINFKFGQIDPDRMEESSVFTYPFTTVDTVGSQDLGSIYNSTFSGPVIGVISIHHSWPDGSALEDFASPVDLTEHAVLYCLKDPAQQQWGAGVNNLQLRKGGVRTERTEAVFGGENWRIRLRVFCIFELTV